MPALPSGPRRTSSGGGGSSIGSGSTPVRRTAAHPTAFSSSPGFSEPSVYQVTRPGAVTARQTGQASSGNQETCGRNRPATAGVGERPSSTHSRSGLSAFKYHFPCRREAVRRRAGRSSAAAGPRMLGFQTWLAPAKTSVSSTMPAALSFWCAAPSGNRPSAARGAGPSLVYPSLSRRSNEQSMPRKTFCRRPA